MHRPPPDLRTLPRERWREELERVDHRRRMSAYFALAHDPALQGEAMQVIEDILLDIGLDARRPTLERALPYLPVPAAPAPRRGTSVQVNVRLRRDQHADLVEAAALLGLKPAQLAKAFIADGTRRLLIQRDA